MKYESKPHPSTAWYHVYVAGQHITTTQIPGGQQAALRHVQSEIDPHCTVRKVLGGAGWAGQVR